MVRFATFNVQHGVRSDGSGVDVAALARACAVLDADLLTVQEVDVGVARSGGVDQVAAIADATGLQPTFVRTLDLEGGAYGHALFARGEVAVVERIELDSAGAEPRAAVVADVLLLAEVEVRVVATHLSVAPPVAAAQLRSLLSGLRPPSGIPSVLMGDCNLGRGAVRQVLRPAGFRLPRSRPTFPASWPRRWIDHVALSDGLEAVSTQVRRFAVSDHRALVVEARVVTPAAPAA